MANDNRINDKTYQVGKFVDVREITALTSTATVNLDFTEPKEWTLTATQATVFNITGTYETGDTVWVHVTGAFGSGFKSVCLNSKVNSQAVTLASISAPTPSDVTLFGVEGNYTPTGCLFEQMLYYPGTHLSATQLEQHRKESITTFTYLNN